MNHQYPNAPAYAPTHPLNHQQVAPQSRPQSHHTLPPLTSGNHATPTFNNPYSTRNQNQQSSLMIAPHEQISQPGLYPVYAPTGNILYNGQSATFSQPSHSQQLHQQSRPPSVTGLPPQPAYTSAPAQGHLANLLPAPPKATVKDLFSLGNHINQLDSPEKPQPTHVVGSQGRRGILPSVAGRPAAVVGANTSGQRAAPTPLKNAEGKYPCEFCNKSYLHAKHLKRHLLRHTGVRPYTCGLCEDTFSRSDILKRHFQKCSVRRGNPSGENHLSHSRANKKSRQENASRIQSKTPTGVNQAQEMEVFTPTSLDGSFDINAMNLDQSRYVDSADQDSRSNSIKQSKRSTGSHSNRTSLGMLNHPSAYDPTPFGYGSGQITPDSAPTSGAATPFNSFLPDSRSNQISPSGAYNTGNGSDIPFGGVTRAHTSSHYTHIAGQRGGPDVDWASYSNYNSNDDYGHSQYPSGTNTPLHRIKSEADLSNMPIADYTSYLQTKA